MAAALVALAFALGSPAAAQQGQWTGPFASDAKWGPSIDLEAKFGNRRSIFEAALFVPLAQNDTTLLFADTRFKTDDISSLEGNFGLGLRHMLPGGFNLGTYGFYDLRRSSSMATFNQLTFGAEVLSTNFDLRANFYLPVGATQKVVGAGTGGTTPTVTLSGTSFLVTFPGGAITEQALRGFDVEAGARVPIFDTSSAYDLRVYAGMYRFSAADVPAVIGPRIRLELTNYRLSEVVGWWSDARLTVGAEYQYDYARGHQAFAGLRLRLPLQAEPRRQPLSYQERRMTTPIARDVDIVVRQRSTGGPGTTETATATYNGQAVTVINSDTTSGASLPTAVATAGAGSTVLLVGTFNTSAIVALQAGQTMLGAGTLALTAASGRTVSTTTARASIIGAVAGNNPAVALANNSTLTGMYVSNTATGGGTPNPFAVRANGVTGATVSNNTLLGTGDNGGGTAQALLITGASSNITVSGNSLSATGTTGITVGLNVVNSTGILVINNTMSASSNPPSTQSRAIVVNNGSFATGSTGNTITNGICSVALAGTGSIGLTSGGTCP